MRHTDKPIIERIKKEVIELINMHNGITYTDLYVYLLGVDITFDREDIERAVSEAVGENLVMRIEYIVPGNRSRFHSFYLPIGSRLI